MARKKKHTQPKRRAATRSRRKQAGATGHAKTSACEIYAQPLRNLNPQTYQQYRDELAALLEQAAGLPRLLPESAKQIEVARRKLYENQFEITLVGEFQGGKSTTFNNICDGREISPRGHGGGGLKTSACIIRAQNLADPNEEEHGIVRWRSPEEVLMGFDEIIEGARVTAHPESPLNTKIEDGQDAHELLPTFAPSSSKGRKQIQKAAVSQIEEWKRDPASYDPEGLGKVDLIRFALITANFYEHPTIKKLRRRRRFSIAEIRSLVRFPEDWEIRWAKWNPEAFKAEEVAFSFLAAVDCYLHSASLSRLGCAITDCPGLFASAWDSKVAREAIHRADAVLYLVSGDKALSLSELTSLRSLPLAKGMILVGSNVRTLSWEGARRVQEASRELLVSQGFDIEANKVRPFHAGLALFSRQLEQGVENLDSTTLAALKADLQLPDTANHQLLQERLRRKLVRFMESLDPNDEGSVDDVLPRNAYLKSQILPLLDAVETFVISRKAGSILVGNAKRVQSSLIETEGSLLAIEESSTIKAEEQESAFKLAEDELRRFEKCSKSLVDGFGNEAANALADSFWKQIEQKKEKYIEDLSEKIRKRINELQWSFKSSKCLVDDLTNLSQNCFSMFLEKESHDWIAQIRQRKNKVYNREIFRPLEKVHDELKCDWEAILRKRIPTLEKIEIPVLDAMQPGADFELPPAFVNAVGEIAQRTRARAFWACVNTFFSLGLTQLLKRQRDLWAGGKDELKKEIGGEFVKLRDPVYNKAKGVVRKFIDVIRQRLDDEVVKHPRRVFEDRKRRAEEQLRMAKGERIKFAQEAKQAREQLIAPLRSKCDAFLAKVKSLFVDSDA